MKNAELQMVLREYPDDMEVKIYRNHNMLHDLTTDHITDYAKDDNIDEETGELTKGVQPRVIVFDPPIS